MTEIGDEASIAPDFKPWRTGEPYNFPLPKFDGGDPWKVLLEKRKRDDYGRCEVWKDEVQNLLIFAGLFSAVVTAFVVESYTTLQEDPGERAVLLLNQISAQLRDPSNATLLPDSDFSPKSSDLRVNIFWFLSLIFSLVTVLVGILSLQWLREYQRPRNIKSRLAFALHHMHTTSLDAWYMPEIFASLPLLLQLALVLFFIGLCDFTWSLNQSLAIPIIITIFLTLTFFIVTTVLPTLQATTLLFRRKDNRNLKPRVPCPYNSPQAWVFHRLYCLLFSLYRSSKLLFLREGMIPLKITPLNIFCIFHTDYHGGWTDIGSGWLYQRDADYINATLSLGSADSLGHPGLTRVDLPRESFLPLYDSAEALKIVRDTLNPSTERTELAALYTCVSQLTDPTSSNLGYNFGGIPWINYSYYVKSLVTRTANQTTLYIDDRHLPILDELNFVSFFVGNLWSLLRRDKVLRKNIIERSVRLTEWVYGQGKMRRMIPAEKYAMPYSSSTPLNAVLLLKQHDEELHGVGDQVAVMIRRFFETILEYQLPDEPPCLSHTSINAYPFLFAAATILLETTSASAVAYNERTLDMLVDWLHQSRREGIRPESTEDNSKPLLSLHHSLKQYYVFTMAIIYVICFERAVAGPIDSRSSNRVFNFNAALSSLKDVLKTIYYEQIEQDVGAFNGQIVEPEDARTGTGEIQVIVEAGNPENPSKEKAWKEHLKEILWSAGLDQFLIEVVFRS